MTSSTSSCRPGDSGHTRLDAEDVATRAAGFILRTGAAGAEQRASGSFSHLISRQISRQICHLNHFTTERGTTSRKITPTTTNTGDTRGGKQRDHGHHHQRRTHTSTNTGSPLTRGALVRAHMARLQAGTDSAILPTTGITFNRSGRPPENIIMVFPRLRPTPFSHGYTATDTTYLRTRGLHINSSSTNTSKTLRGRRCQSRGGGDAVPLPCLHRPRRRWFHS